MWQTLKHALVHVATLGMIIYLVHMRSLVSKPTAARMALRLAVLLQTFVAFNLKLAAICATYDGPVMPPAETVTIAPHENGPCHAPLINMVRGRPQTARLIEWLCGSMNGREGKIEKGCSSSLII